MLGTSDTWSLSRWFHPQSDPADYVGDCWILILVLTGFQLIVICHLSKRPCSVCITDPFGEKVAELSKALIAFKPVYSAEIAWHRMYDLCSGNQ